MQSVLGDRVIGICDSPIGLARRADRALGLDPDGTEIDYVGLNHLGWLRALRVDGVDHLPRPARRRRPRCGRLEEGRLFGAGLAARPRRAAQRVPLLLLLHPRRGGRRSSQAPQTRGEFLLDQQSAFYDAVAAPPRPGARPSGTGYASSATPPTCARRGREGEERDAADVAGGGYEGVALAIMAAIARGERLDDDPQRPQRRGGGRAAATTRWSRSRARSTATARTPPPWPPVEGHQLGLMQQVKAVERTVIEAARTGSARCRPARLRAAPPGRLGHARPDACSPATAPPPRRSTPCCPEPGRQWAPGSGQSTERIRRTSTEPSTLTAAASEVQARVAEAEPEHGRGEHRARAPAAARWRC